MKRIVKKDEKGKSDKGDDGKAYDNGTNAELMRLQAKDPTTWTVSEVGKWLDFIEMGQYKIIFIENSISGAELFELEMEDLGSINVRKLGHRKRILKRIAMLKKNSKAAFMPHSEDDSSDSSSGHKSGSSSSAPSTSGTKGSSGAVPAKPQRKGPSSSVSSNVSASDEVMLKCCFQDDVTVLRVKSSISMAKLRSKIRSEYKRDMEIRYKDDDGDLITIRKGSHLRAAIKEAEGRAVRLQLEPKEAGAQTEGFEPGDTVILDNLVDACIVLNKRGNIIFFNRTAETMFGWKSKEVVGKSVKLLMPESTAAQHDRYIKNYLATGEGKIMGSGRKVIAVRRDKTTFPIYLSISETIKDKEHNFIGTVKDLSNMNVSSVSSDEEAQGKADFNILDNILDVSIVVNEKGSIQYFNRKAEEFFGYKRGEVLGRNVKILMPSPFAEEHDGYLHHYVTTGQAKVIGIGRDVVAQTKDGVILPVHLSLTEQGLEGARLFTGILRPLKAESTSEKSILQQEREVLDNLLVPAIIIDDKGIIHAFNKPASGLFGYTLIEVVGKNVKMLMPNPDKSRHDDYIKNYLRTGRAKVLGAGRDVVAQAKDGSMIPVRLSVTERKDDERRIFTGIVQKL